MQPDSTNWWMDVAANGLLMASISFSRDRSVFDPALWALPEMKKFPGQRQNHAPIRLTAGPLNFQFALPAKYRNEILTIGTAYRAEVVRYDKNRDDSEALSVGYLGRVVAAFSSRWTMGSRTPRTRTVVLWRSRVDGSEKIQLTVPPMRTGAPRWSPDGKQIAFHAVLPGGVTEYLCHPECRRLS